MADMLVNLLNLPEKDLLFAALEKENIYIRRALAPDKVQIIAFVKEQSGVYASGECDVSFARIPISCYVATQGKKLIGYACYNATAPDFFGPTKVMDEMQGKKIGKALLLACLHAMRDEGYIYAIIGGVGPVPFYEKCVGATLIPDSTPGVYKDFLKNEDN